MSCADTARRFDAAVGDPPLDNGTLWSTSCPGATIPFLAIIRRARLRAARRARSPLAIDVFSSWE